AEDGIRDFHVTGVQTCALPISAVWGTPTHPSRPPSSGITQPPVLATVLRRLYEESLDKARARTMAVRLLPRVLAFHRWLYRVREIGRASCRERGQVSGGGGS